MASMIQAKFLEMCARYGSKAAIVHEDARVTYTELFRRMSAAVRRLASLFPPRTAIGILTDDPLPFVCHYLAASELALIVVPIDPRLGAAERRTLIEHCRLGGLLVGNGYLAAAPDLADGFSRIAMADGDDIHIFRSNCPVSDDAYHPLDFVIQYTSGTTGTPKAIALSIGNIHERVMNWSQCLALKADDTILCSLTLSHSHGMDVLMLPGLLHGCTVVAPNVHRLTPKRILTLIGEHRVSIFSTLPFMYDLLNRLPGVVPGALESVRHLISGSAPLSAETESEFFARFGRHISQVYGLSEIGPICFSHDLYGPGRLGAFVPGVEWTIVPAAPGASEGELVVTGSALSRGYLDSPDEQRLMFRDGWLWTQDMIELDAQGVRYIGRKSRFINSGGNKIDPFEIESLIESIGRVRAVVYGKPDRQRGERPVAVLEDPRRDPALLDKVQSGLKQRLAAYKLPAEYHVVESLPRSGMGKVQIGKLKEMFA